MTAAGKGWTAKSRTATSEARGKMVCLLSAITDRGYNSKTEQIFDRITDQQDDLSNVGKSPPVEGWPQSRLIFRQLHHDTQIAIGLKNIK
jgi:hypothetical protein